MPLPAVLEDALGLRFIVVATFASASALIPVLAEIKLAIVFASASTASVPPI